MQIHELPQHSGTPANESDFAIDTGTQTFKIPFASLGEAIITAATAAINGVTQTVKAAIEALTGRVTTLEGTATSLQSQITDLNTVKSTTMTFLGKTVTVYKVGKVVLFQYFASTGVDIPATAETAAGTLPSGYRPVVRCAFELFASGTQKLQIVFNTSGAVTVYNFSSSAVNADSGWIRSFYMFIAS